MIVKAFSYALAVALAMLHAAEAAPGVSKSHRPTAKTMNGTVIGRYLPSFEQDLFLGVPFAKAPRLSNPLPVDTSFDEFDASEYGYTCYGFGSNPILTLTQSEDCLNLNIIRPAGVSSKTKLPVLLWIYGGGFSQ